MKLKSGISLIAVLMFMLAATTASIVVFRYVSQEGFASGARLKNSEAYQASQAGLEAVEGWLANKGADAGAIIKTFEEGKKPVLLISKTSNGETNLLSNISNQKQNFKVYLIGADVSKKTYQLKFMSVGEGRDGAKYSQTGIFDVDGLYKTTIYRPPTPGKLPEIPAFYGGIDANTQGKFSSAIIIGDAKLNGLTTTGDLIVTGNLEVKDNSYKYLGCKDGKNKDYTPTGNVYINGKWEVRGFDICGDAYVGDTLTTTSNPQFRGHLYAKGGIKNNGLRVYKNLTLGGDLIASTSQVTIDGNFVKEGNARIQVEDGSKISIGRDVWSNADLFTVNSQNNSDKFKNPPSLFMGGYNSSSSNSQGSSSSIYLYIPKPAAKKCGEQSADDKNRNCDQSYYGWYQPAGSNFVHFSSRTTHKYPHEGKPEGANLLTSMADQIVKKGDKWVVDDPLEVPVDIKKKWMEKGNILNKLVNIEKKTAGLPLSCVRLVKNPPDANNDYDSHWLFGDAVQSCTYADYPSAGMPNQCKGSSNNKYNFVRAANDCYAKLVQDNRDDILYSQSGSERFLALVINNPDEKSPGQNDYFNGNFIFAYPDEGQKPNKTMKLPPTTNDSKIFLYFPQGSDGSLPLENTCLGLPSPCKRNYFIYSEGDFAGSSGTTTINGAIFLANGAKITGSLPDATIEFNEDLFKALTEAKIVVDKKARPEAPPYSEDELKDSYHIPSTSHLKVSLQSRYASKEKIPKEEKVDFIYANPGILVLPRVIYLKEGDANNAAELKKFYTVLYLNGALTPDSENDALNCPPKSLNAEDDRGTNRKDMNCILTSKACSSSPMCQSHPFYIVRYDKSVAGSGGGGSSGSAGSSSSGGTLTCLTGFPPTPVVYPGRVSVPVLRCPDGNPPSGNVTWSPQGIDFAHPAPGTYSDITATANCSNGLQTARCNGSFSVISNIKLEECKLDGTIKEGKIIPTATGNGITLTLRCTDDHDPKSVFYPNITAPPSAGTYTNEIVISANCGNVQGVQATCIGTLNVVGFKCEPKKRYVKAGEKIESPTMTCTPSTFGLSGTPPHKPADVPKEAAPGTNYEVKLDNEAKCGGVSFKSNDNDDLGKLNCGTVTVSGLSCTNLPNIVTSGTRIAMPNVTCVDGKNAENIYFFESASNYGVNESPVNWNITARRFITAQADCGDDKNLKANCGVVNVADNTCQYQPTWCNGIPVNEVVTLSQNGALGGNNKHICVYATNIESMGNENGKGKLKVNGNVLGGESTNGRCGGNPDWHQINCTTALNAITKADGGYYIYIPDWVGDFKTTGGTPFCSGTENPCDYNPQWCGGNSYGTNFGYLHNDDASNLPFAANACQTTKNYGKEDTDDDGNTYNVIVKNGSGTTKKIYCKGTGGCSYIRDFGKIVYANGSTLLINGVRQTCARSEGCELTKPAKVDGGYYIYLESGSIKEWEVNTQKSGQQLGHPLCRSVSVATTCDNYIGEIPPAANPTPPVNPLSACFKYVGDGGYKGSCFVCHPKHSVQDASNGLYRTCWSSWIWAGTEVITGNMNTTQQQINSNSPNVYVRVDCPSSGSGGGTSGTSQSSSSVASSSSAASSSSTPSSNSNNEDEATYCSGASSIVNGCNNAGTTGSVCFKKEGNLAGWSANNTSGRTCKINGGSGITLADGTQTTTATAINGHVYINCSGGNYSYFATNCW